MCLGRPPQIAFSARVCFTEALLILKHGHVLTFSFFLSSSPHPLPTGPAPHTHTHTHTHTQPLTLGNAGAAPIWEVTFKGSHLREDEERLILNLFGEKHSSGDREGSEKLWLQDPSKALQRQCAPLKVCLFSNCSKPGGAGEVTLKLGAPPFFFL